MKKVLTWEEFEEIPISHLKKLGNSLPNRSFTWFEVCLACKCKEFYTIVDLGEHPLPNVYPLTPNEEVNKYPLGLNFCARCCHIQLFGVPNEPLFEDYSYVNTSDSYRKHQDSLVCYLYGRVQTIHVLDVGGNNGDLAEAFNNHEIKCDVIDPSKNFEISRFLKNVPSITGYFTEELAEKLKNIYDLVVMTNVLPHTPDPENMLKAAKRVLYSSTNSKILVEFVYAKSTYELRDLGQIYHEHCSYFTLNSLKALLERVDMAVNDIEFFPEVHGGTIRVLIDPCFQPSDHCPKFYEMLHAENLSGIIDYESLKEWGDLLKRNVIHLKDYIWHIPSERKVVLYGASAKASTLCNMVEFKNGAIDYALDDNKLKQGRYIPGTSIPIKPPSELNQEENPIVLVGAHNHYKDIVKRIKGIIPKATIVNYVPSVMVEEI